MFEEIFHKDKPFNDYEVVYPFPTIGRRTMLLNARRIIRKGTGSDLILLAIEDITDRRLAEENVKNMAITDALTGIYNRRGFLALAEQQIKTANRNKEQMRLFYIDVDSMKEINDKLGHVAGDQSLIETANVLRRTFRKSDIIARIGGDEFVILAIDVKGIDSQVFSERLQKNIDELNRKESRSYRLGLSWAPPPMIPNRRRPCTSLCQKPTRSCTPERMSNRTADLEQLVRFLFLLFTIHLSPFTLHPSLFTEL